MLQPDGSRARYVPLAWKRYFAELFIEPTFEEYTVRGTGELKVRVPTQRFIIDASLTPLKPALQ